MINGLKFEYST